MLGRTSDGVLNMTAKYSKSELQKMAITIRRASDAKTPLGPELMWVRYIQFRDKLHRQTGFYYAEIEKRITEYSMGVFKA